MTLLYNISISLYSLAIWLAAPFNRKARLLVAGRRRWREPFAEKPLDPARPVAWFHAASLGEFEQGRPVIEAFRKQQANYQVVLSFFSPSGYEVRKTYAGADVVTYLPADTAAHAREWLTLVRPQKAYFIKYEFWYHYLHALHEANIETVSFSAIFRPSQLFFKTGNWKVVSRFYRQMLAYFSHIFVQNQTSVDLLRGIGIMHVTLAGDTRFDRVAQVAAGKRDIPEVAAFVGADPVLVVGSAWAADMAVLIPFLNQFDQPLRVIIAPHEIHPDEISSWQTQLKKPSVRFSELDQLTGNQLVDKPYLFVDNIGMLTSLYQYGTFAFIGGAFGKGLHNCLEAATFGLPLCFGPNYRKFQEALDLIILGGAFSVQSTHDLSLLFTDLYKNALARERAGAVCKAYVLSHVGATAIVLGTLKESAS